MVTYQDREKMSRFNTSSSHDDEDAGILADSIRTHTKKNATENLFKMKIKEKGGKE